MKVVIVVFVEVFFLLLLMVGGVSIIGAGIDARNADATKSGYVAELENSNFSPRVIGGLFEDASTQGYDLTLTLYGDNGARTVVNEMADIPTAAGTYMARVDLGFSYSFPLLDSVPIPHSTVGYAR